MGKVNNPLSPPSALFVLLIQGLGSDLHLNIQGTKFPLENQGDIDGQYTLLSLRTAERYGENSILLKINACDELYGPKSEYRDLLKSVPADSKGRLEEAKTDPVLGQTLRDGIFNETNEPDADFLIELKTVKLLLKAVMSNKDKLHKGAPDIYWVELTSLPGVQALHGSDSTQCKEAVRLLEQMCMEIQTVIQDAYEKNAVVSVITESSVPDLLTRRTRNLLQEKEPEAAPILRAVEEYMLMNNYSAYGFQDDFHVAFALTAFTSVILTLTVLGVSVGIWFMDPGRDSIIYRMTSQRKKD